jgi:hypothetical protein
MLSSTVDTTKESMNMEIYLVGDENYPAYLGTDQDDAVEAANEAGIEEISVYTLERTVQGETRITFDF